MKWPRIRNRIDSATEPDGVVPWGGRDGSFGWFLYVAPWWWPRGSDGPRCAGLLHALARVNAQIRLRTGRLGRASKTGLGRWQDLPNLVPAHSVPRGTPDFDDVSSPAGLCGRGHEVYLRILPAVRVQRPGVDEELISWRDFGSARVEEPGWRPGLDSEGFIDENWHKGPGGQLNYLSVGELPEPECSYVEEILIGDLRTRGFEGGVVQAWWDGDGRSDLPDATPIRIFQPKRDLIPFLSEAVAFTYFTSLNGWTASLIYPDDCAWALATDNSLVSSYLGCSRELAKQFHDSPNLEVLEVSTDDPLS